MLSATPAAGALRLHALQAGDEALYVALYTDAETMRHVAAAADVATARRGFAATLRLQAQRPPRRRTWTIRRSDVSLGLIGLVFDRDDAGAELGVVLPPAHQGRGIATAAIAALADRAFAEFDLQRLHTRHDGDHVAAAALMAGLGFQRGETADSRLGWTWVLTPARWDAVRGQRRPAGDPLP